MIESLFDIKGCASQDDPISQVFASRKLLNFAVASKQGCLTIWKLDVDNKHSKLMLHDFERLPRPIVDFIAHPREDSYVIAGCLDSNIRVYDIWKCEHIYTFKLPENIKIFRFLSPTIFVGHYENGHMHVGKMNFPTKIMLQSNQNVVKVGRVYNTPGDK
jgi:hypothetical protein